MALGDLITADHQVQIEDFLLGPGTDYRVLNDFNPYIWPEMTSRDFRSVWGEGTLATADLADARTLDFRVLIEKTTPATAITAYEDLAEAFAPSDVDLDLTWRINGTLNHYFGRPRAAGIIDTRWLGGGNIMVGCRFLATDPVRYGPLVTENWTLSGTATNFSVTNAGTAAVPWTLSWAADVDTVSALDISINSPVAQSWAYNTVGGVSNDAVEINCGDRFYKRGSNYVPNEIEPTAVWWKIEGGNVARTVTLTRTESSGSVSGTFTYHSGWY